MKAWLRKKFWSWQAKKLDQRYKELDQRVKEDIEHLEQLKQAADKAWLQAVRSTF